MITELRPVFLELRYLCWITRIVEDRSRKGRFTMKAFDQIQPEIELDDATVKSHTIWF